MVFLHPTLIKLEVTSFRTHLRRIWSGITKEAVASLLMVLVHTAALELLRVRGLWIFFILFIFSWGLVKTSGDLRPLSKNLLTSLIWVSVWRSSHERNIVALKLFFFFLFLGTESTTCVALPWHLLKQRKKNICLGGFWTLNMLTLWRNLHQYSTLQTGELCFLLGLQVQSDDAS